MLLVVDANIIFSALIKHGANRIILLFSGHNFYAPQFTIEEFNEHIPELMKKTRLSRKELNQTLETLIETAEIKLVPFEEFKHKRKSAIKIAPDIDDVAYIALALHLQCPLWTHDKKLKKQDRVRIITTK